VLCVQHKVLEDRVVGSGEVERILLVVAHSAVLVRKVHDRRV